MYGILKNLFNTRTRNPFISLNNLFKVSLFLIIILYSHLDILLMT